MWFVFIPVHNLTMDSFRQFTSSKKPERMPDFEKMMKKLSENNDMMMMEYATFFRKEVEANFVPRPKDPNVNKSGLRKPVT